MTAAPAAGGGAAGGPAAGPPEPPLPRGAPGAASAAAPAPPAHARSGVRWRFQGRLLSPARPRPGPASQSPTAARPAAHPPPAGRRRTARQRGPLAATGNAVQTPRPRPPARPHSPAPRWWLLPRFLGLGMVAAALGSARLPRPLSGSRSLCSPPPGNQRQSADGRAGALFTPTPLRG